jgi:hypothetical protein
MSEGIDRGDSYAPLKQTRSSLKQAGMREESIRKVLGEPDPPSAPLRQPATEDYTKTSKAKTSFRKGGKVSNPYAK